MYIDEFVKRLYDFMGIYRIFWSQNSHYRYLPIFYRYLLIFADIFSEIPAQVRVLHIRNFSVEKSAILPIFPLIDFSSTFSSRCLPKTEFFCDISIEKIDFFFPGFGS